MPHAIPTAFRYRWLAGLVALLLLTAGAAPASPPAAAEVGGDLAWWRVTRTGDDLVVVRPGCAPPGMVDLHRPGVARSLAVGLSAACTRTTSVGPTPLGTAAAVDGAPGGLVPVTDLDGDETRDVAVVAEPLGPTGEQPVDLRAGANGALLWSERGAGTVAAVAGASRADGSPGLVVARLVEPGVDVVARAGAALLELRAYDGAGNQRWAHRVVGASARSGDTGAEVDLAWVAGVTDLVGDPSADVAVARLRVVTVVGNPLYLFAVDVIDGATGDVAGTATIDGTGFPWLDVVADLDGDRRRELALNIALPEAETDLEVWRGDGVRLWEVALPKAVFAQTTAVGDLDGDGGVDLVASGGTLDGGWVVGLTGDGGTKRFQSEAALLTDVFAPGDLDGDGRVEVGVTSLDLLGPLRQPGRPLQIRHRLLSSDGTVRVEAVDELALASPDPETSDDVVGLSIGLGDAHDVDLDRVGDRWYELAVETIVDGASRWRGVAGIRGGVDLAPLRDLEPFVTRPLLASVDGRGADLRVQRTSADGRQVVTVQDTLSGRPLGDLVVPLGADVTALRGIDLDGDGRDELLAAALDSEFRVVAAGVLAGTPLARSWWLGPTA